MNAVGIFAGRGDVILAMGMAMVFGFWLGIQYIKLKDWVINRRRSLFGK